mmetsp:Transcript_28457/g.47825  ORF Transcript_28457/g.47825 Transcript_28457/m.47825 type:complete len:338 (-) Transcript_28457:126-1139(-)
MNMLLVLSLALVTTVAVGYYVPVAIVPIVRKTASSIYQTSIHMSSSVESSDDASNVNVKLDNVKNMRDLSTAAPGIAPAKIIRTGCVSRATSDDITEMKEKFNFKAFLDLRSPAEIEEDEHINSQVYSGFHDYQFDSRQKSFVTIKTSSSSGSGSGSETSSTDSNAGTERKRFYISLMSESLIKKGVFYRLKKREKLKSLGLFALSGLSRRANKKVRGIFLDIINAGGLALLNELVVDQSGADIAEALKLVAQPENHPVALYCTAGKDRTGLMAMLVLSVLGVSDEAILADYTLSDSAYKDIGDNKAMVASLQQVRREGGRDNICNMYYNAAVTAVR